MRDDEGYDEDDYVNDRLDPEAQLLCSMIWHKGTSPALSYVVEHLSEDDFFNPMYGWIFTIIAQAVGEGMPHDATAINVRLAAEGQKADGYRRVLLAIVGLMAPSDNLIYYADQVISTWYRRQYAQMATALVHISKEAPEGELFDRMVKHGRQQREAKNRRETFLQCAQRHLVAVTSEGKKNDE